MWAVGRDRRCRLVPGERRGRVRQGASRRVSAEYLVRGPYAASSYSWRELVGWSFRHPQGPHNRGTRDDNVKLPVPVSVELPRAVGLVTAVFHVPRTGSPSTVENHVSAML